MTSEELEDLSLPEQAEKKICFGENLIKSFEEFKNVQGIQKLCRKVNQELKFLKKVIKKNSLQKEHLQCSNLTHYAALLDTLKTVEDCQSVGKVFSYMETKITVDIVSDGGLTWTKVIARNPRSVTQICLGNASYGVRSIIDQAKEFSNCARNNLHLFQPPKVVFVFVNGVSDNIAKELESYEIIVQGTRLEPFCEPNEGSNTNYEFSSVAEVENPEESTDIRAYLDSISYELPKRKTTKNVDDFKRVNLDVSAMLAYCSSVTNGGADLYDFDIPTLKQQAENERLRPQKPILDNFFKDKQLFCCETAKYNFENIVETVGGPNEKIRAKELLDRLIVLPDDCNTTAVPGISEFYDIFNYEQYNHKLQVGGKIKSRSLKIFVFGDRIGAVTVSANDGFVRAAKQQGINFVVFIHESRPLTEQKEKAKAIPIAK